MLPIARHRMLRPGKKLAVTRNTPFVVTAMTMSAHMPINPHIDRMVPASSVSTLFDINTRIPEVVRANGIEHRLE